MALLKTDTEAAEAALSKAERRLTEFNIERSELNARLSLEVEYDAHLALQQQITAADQKVTAAGVARDHAVKRLIDATALAAEADADRRYAAAKKSARNDERLTLEIAATAEKLAELLSAHQGNREQIEAANAERGERPFIPDGERRIREQPAREIPADVRHEMGWIDANGRRPNQLRDNGAGRLVPTDHGNYEYKEIGIVQTPARHQSAHMPKRLADEIRLVNLKGEQIWPRRS